MLKDFKAFVVRGNVLDLAIGIIIGGAFGKIVSSFVSDVLMPPIGMLLGRVDFSNLFVVLNGQSYPSLAEAKKAGAPTINYGLFINTLIDFLIVAFCIFLVVRIVNRILKTQPAAPSTKDCPHCLMAIPLGAKKCGHCTTAFTFFIAATILTLNLAPAFADDRPSIRGARVSAHFNPLLQQPFGDDARTGFGLTASYEFFVTPRFVVALPLSWRMYPGTVSLHQVGYGVWLRHGIGSLDAAVRPYASYGLLMNVSRRKGIDGSGISHDTRLGGGVELGDWFIEGHYHFTRLGFFETTSVTLDFMELGVGYQWTW